MRSLPVSGSFLVSCFAVNIISVIVFPLPLVVEVLAQREPVLGQVPGLQDPLHLPMALEDDPHHVERLPLVVIGAAPDVERRGQRRVVLRHRDMDLAHRAVIVGGQMIDHAKNAEAIQRLDDRRRSVPTGYVRYRDFREVASRLRVARVRKMITAPNSKALIAQFQAEAKKKTILPFNNYDDAA